MYVCVYVCTRHTSTPRLKDNGYNGFNGGSQKTTLKVFLKVLSIQIGFEKFSQQDNNI